MIINQLNISLFFIYFFIQLFIAPKNNYSLISSINTILTASIANYLFITDNNNFINIYNCNKNEINLLYFYPNKFLFSYVIYDIYYSFKPFKVDMLIHGLLLLTSIVLVELYSIQHYICPALLMQTSTLFLNYIKSSDICGLLFFVTFLAYRIIIFPLLSYKFYIDNQTSIINFNLNEFKFIFVLIFGINILNFYWFKKILKIFINKIKLKLS